MNLLQPSLASSVGPARSRLHKFGIFALLLGLGACVEAAASPVGDDGLLINDPSGDDDEETPSYPSYPSDGNGPPPSTPSYPSTPSTPGTPSDPDTDSSADPDGPAGGDIGSILCGLFGCDDAGTPPATPSDGNATSGDPNDTIVPGREPDATNIPECPKHAPENPIGSCIGVPIYATCGYSGYNCICDWIHWICL